MANPVYFVDKLKGVPDYPRGRELGVFVYVTPDNRWHIRWNGNEKGKPITELYLWSGRIVADRLEAVEPVWFDRRQPDQFHVNRDNGQAVLSFNGVVFSDEDGLDFTAVGDMVHFELAGHVKGKPREVLTSEIIFLGATKTQPTATTFDISLSQEQPPVDGPSSTTVTVPTFTPKPIVSQGVPQHPYMAPNGRSNIHNDAYMTDTYTSSGPLGGTLTVETLNLGGLCGTITFDEQGRLITVCAGPNPNGGTFRQLLLIDPDSLAVLAAYDLPVGTGGNTSFGGGGYFYLDNLNRPVVPTVDQTIVVFRLQGRSGKTLKWDVVERFDLSKAIADPQASILSALPDWSGRIWWITDTGLVGYIRQTENRTTYPHVQLDGELIGNSFAVDETGGVYIVSNYAQYRFDVDVIKHKPKITWREVYDRGGRMKPGQKNFGSGTTPTLLGEQYLGITDNADPRMNVLVYQRQKECTLPRLITSQSVFARQRSCTENSLIGVNNSFAVENNYGYLATPTQPVGEAPEPGLTRVDFSADTRTAVTFWVNDRVSVPSIVSKLSLANGLLYTYTWEGGMWYFTAVDFADGLTIYRVPTGEGELFDNHYSGLALAPNGDAYIAIFEGLVKVSPVQS